MGWQDVLAGIFSGIGGDPSLPIKMKMMQEQLKMEAEQHGVEQQYRKALMKKLDFEMQQAMEQNKPPEIVPETEQVNQFPVDIGEGGPKTEETGRVDWLKTAAQNPPHKLDTIAKMKAFLTPEKPTLHNVAPGNVVLDATGKPIYTAPQKEDEGDLKLVDVLDESGKPTGMQQQAIVYKTPGKKPIPIPGTTVAKPSELKQDKFQEFAELYPDFVKTHPRGTPEYAKKFDSWKAQEATKINVAVAGSEARGEAYGKNRPLRVIDLETYQPTYKTMRDIEKEPERYIELTEGSRAMSQINLLEDIRGSLDLVKTSLNKSDVTFDEGTRLKIFEAWGATNPKSALQNVKTGIFGKSLNKNQKQYLADSVNLAEQIMSMRATLRMGGQGSEDMRDAMRATIPGKGTFDKEYANIQIDNVHKLLDRLTRYIFNVPAKKGSEVPIKPKKTITLKSGKIIEVED